MTDFIYAGTTTPGAVRINVVPGTSGIDLTTIASAVFKVRRESDKSLATWTATMTSQTATTLTLTYVLASGDDDIVGTYRIYALLTISSGGGTVRTDTLATVVKGEFEV